MQITIELPEDIAVGLESKWKGLPRAALESQAPRQFGRVPLTPPQVRRLLGSQTRMEVNAFLKEHEI